MPIQQNDPRYWDLLKNYYYETATPLQKTLSGTGLNNGVVNTPPPYPHPLQPLPDRSGDGMSVLWPGSGRGWENPTSKEFSRTLEQDDMARMQRESEFRQQYGLPGLGGVGGFPNSAQSASSSYFPAVNEIMKMFT